MTLRQAARFAVLAPGCALAAAAITFAMIHAPAARAQSVPRNWVASTAAESCHVVKAGPGGFDSLDVSSTSAGWVMVLDAATCPSNGVIASGLALVEPLGQAGSGQFAWSYDRARTPLWFINGVTVAVSSTGPFTLTLESTAFIMGVPR